VTVDRALVAHPTQATLDMWKPARESFLLGNTRAIQVLPNVTYGLLAFAEEGVLPNPVTDAVALCLADAQRSNGSWGGGDTRPPLADDSPIHFTALAVRGLTVYSPPGRRQEMKARVARAREFLRRAKADDTQDQVFELLGLVWSGGTASEVSRQAKRLLPFSERAAVGASGQQWLPTLMQRGKRSTHFMQPACRQRAPRIKRASSISFVPSSKTALGLCGRVLSDFRRISQPVSRMGGINLSRQLPRRGRPSRWLYALDHWLVGGLGVSRRAV
jgi:hypothetical protein